MVSGVARKGTSYAYFGTLRSPVGGGAKPLPAAIRRQASRTARPTLRPITRAALRRPQLTEVISAKFM